MEYQTTAIQHGIGNSTVSDQWFNRSPDEKLLSLRDMLAHKKNDAARLTERVMDTRKIAVVAQSESDEDRTGELLLCSQELGPQPLNNWSFSQISQRAGAPAGYLKNLPGELAADNINWGLKFNRDNQTVKGYARPRGDENPGFRAVTSENYGRILDHEIISNCLNLSERYGWKVPGAMSKPLGDGRVLYDADLPVTEDTTTLFASDRDVFIFLVDDHNPISIGTLSDGSPDLVFRGFYAWNSEVGSRTAGVAAFYLRGVCQNRCLWGVEDFQEMSIRHTKNAPIRFESEIQPALHSFANRSTAKFLDGVQAARDIAIGREEDEKIDFLRQRGGLSNRLAKAAAARHLEEEGRPIENAWDAVQAITATARDIPNNDNRLDLEQRAGAILDAAA